MRPYRCYNPACGGYPKWSDFEADSPVCPKCGTDARTDPQLVTPLVVIHFDELVRVGKGKNVRACEPGTAIYSNEDGRFGGTGHAPSVTCPACKGTEAYQKALREHEEG